MFRHTLGAIPPRLFCGDYERSRCLKLQDNWTYRQYIRTAPKVVHGLIRMFSSDATRGEDGKPKTIGRNDAAGVLSMLKNADQTMKKRSSRFTKRAIHESSSEEASRYKEFNKTAYVTALLQEGKLNNTKLFPGLGPAKVSGLMNDMGGPPALLRALETKDLDSLTNQGRLKPQMAKDVCVVWETLWSEYPVQTATEMLKLGGLSSTDFHSALWLASNLDRHWFGTLLRMCTSRAAHKRVESFVEFHKQQLTVEQRIACFAKSLLSDSSQVCLSPIEMIEMVRREEEESGTGSALFAKSVPISSHESLLMQALTTGDARTHFQFEHGVIYLTSSWQLEKDVANLLAVRIHAAKVAAEPIPYDSSLLSAALSVEQRDAVNRGLNSRIFLLTGGPGTGKTYCFGQMLRAWEGRKNRVVVTSFTARSAQNLKDVAAASQATTIHKAFDATYAGSGFRLDRLVAEVFVLEEATMIDLKLFRDILQRVSATETALVLLGDPDQLPAVGPGSVFRDLFDERLTHLVPQARLKEPRRQAGAFESPIHRMAQMINAGVFPDSSCLTKLNRSIFNAEKLNPLRDRACWINAFPKRDTVIALVENILKRFPIEDVQVLVSGRAEIHNLYLKDIFRRANVARRGKSKSTAGPWGANSRAYQEKVRFQIGDRVMHIKNDRDKDVMNGEIGDVVEILPNSRVKVRFQRPDRLVVYEDERELQDLTLAYAMTVHKSQGCEFPVVIILAESFNWTKQMFFTACTRAKGWLFVVGVEQAISTAILTNEKRNSNLVTRILNELSMLQSQRKEDSVVGEDDTGLVIAMDEGVPHVIAFPPLESVSSTSLDSQTAFAIARYRELDLGAWTRSKKDGARNEPVVITSETDVADKSTVPMGQFAPSMDITLEELKWLDEASEAATVSFTSLDVAVGERGGDELVETVTVGPILHPPIPSSLLQSSSSVLESPKRMRGRPPKNPHQLRIVETSLNGNDAEESRENGRNNEFSPDTVKDQILTVPSAFEGGKSFEVNVTKKNCSCPGFHARGWCKHLDSIVGDRN